MVKQESPQPWSVRMPGFVEWTYSWTASKDGGTEDPSFQGYYNGIADAHHVLRRIQRIVDECARRADLEGLEHLALIQVFGHREALKIGQVAERLDIPAAHASRILKELEGKGLVRRSPSPHDRRSTVVVCTAEGRTRLARVDDDVKRRVARFQEELADTERMAALGIFAFYAGLAPTWEDLDRLMSASRLQSE